MLIMALTCCHEIEESYNFNLYYHHQSSSFNTINKHSDIPLAKGLIASDNEGGLSCKSEGKNIIAISYITDKNLLNIKDFYIKTLPQLGWHIASNEEYRNAHILDFVRDSETLEIELVQEDSLNIVKFYAQINS